MEEKLLSFLLTSYTAVNQHGIGRILSLLF